MTFTLEHQLEMLVFYHLQGYESGVELLQAMEEDDFAREHIAPKEGIKKRGFFRFFRTRLFSRYGYDNLLPDIFFRKENR